jgi:hypothetical protein
VTHQPAVDGNHHGIASQPSRSRRGLSLPMAAVAALFVIVSFLTWYGTWFGRNLSDAEVTKYLAEDNNPRHVQHALAQIEARLEREDGSAKRWYPRIVTLAASRETEVRLTVAWLMGSDNRSDDFHSALLRLLEDSEPEVRRNAALALVRFGDARGRQELQRTLRPHPLAAPIEGTISSTLAKGSPVARGTLLARINGGGSSVEVRSPLPGKIDSVKVNEGDKVAAGDTILSIAPDSKNVWEALRGLSLIGQREDLPAVQRYAEGVDAMPQSIRDQAALTAKSIQSRQ